MGSSGNNYLKVRLPQVSGVSGKNLLKTIKVRVPQVRGSSGKNLLEDNGLVTGSRSSVEGTICQDIEIGKDVVNKFAASIIKHCDLRIEESHLITLMRKVFGEWDEDSLEELLTIANESGRNYGQMDVLMQQYIVLKERYNNINAVDDMARRLAVFTKESLFKSLPDILHLALSCFVKAPLEATAEMIVSLINQHGRKE